MTLTDAEAPWGLLGGTFDPPHTGHLVVAQGALKTLALQSICWMPVGIPPHRTPPIATPQQRLAMVRALLTDCPHHYADDHECTVPGPHYTVDTLRFLRTTYSGSLTLLLGADALVHFDRWHRWQEIFSYANIAIARRDLHVPPGEAHYSPALTAEIQERRAAPDALRHAPSGLLCFFDVESPPVSSTQLRQQLSDTSTPPCHLPSPVWDYIQRHRLYEGMTLRHGGP